MRNPLLLPGVLLLSLAVAVFAGCAGRMPAPSPAPPSAGPGLPAPSPEPSAAPAPPPVPAPPPAPVPVPEPAAASPVEKAYEDGISALQEGGYERALEHFASALKEKPGYPEASRGFDNALIALKKSGDASFAQGKPEEAGRRWMGTLRYLANPAAKGRSYPFTRAEIQGHLGRLTAAQMEKGLLSYRKGDIQAAITAWKTILAYDPENEEAARSIRTASTQLENLKKIPPVN